MCTTALNVSYTATNNYVGNYVGKSMCYSYGISICFHRASRCLDLLDIEYVQKQFGFSTASNVAQYTFDFHQKPHRCHPPPPLPSLSDCALSLKGIVQLSISSE